MVDLGFEPSGNHSDGDPEPGTAPPDDLPGIATWLAQAGFQTSLVTTSRFLSSNNPTGNGFQAEVLEDDASAERVTELALQAAATLLDDPAPWFLHVHYRDPYFPYGPPREFVEGLDGLESSDFPLKTQSGVNAVEAAWSDLDSSEQGLILTWLEGFYDGEVRYLDHHLSAFWDGLDSLGALDDTLVVFFTDHGEQFFEHDGLMHYTDLFDEESAAVGALWARSLVPVAFQGPSDHTDLAPAIFDLLGMETPDGMTEHLPGTAPADSPRHSFFGPMGLPSGPINTVDLAGMRLYYRWSGQLQLFDLRADPDSQNDLYGEVGSRRLESLLADEVARIRGYVTWAEPQGLP
jgi:hypothetical protein